MNMSIVMNDYYDTISYNNEFKYITYTNNEKLICLIDELLNEKMNIKIENEIKRYKNNMVRLLKSYDNGNGKEKFNKHEMKLYFMLQDEFSDIIDLRYDIYNNKIQTDNKNMIINTLDEIIKLQRYIIEDINSVVA